MRDIHLRYTQRRSQNAEKLSERGERHRMATRSVIVSQELSVGCSGRPTVGADTDTVSKSQGRPLSSPAATKCRPANTPFPKTSRPTTAQRKLIGSISSLASSARRSIHTSGPPCLSELWIPLAAPMGTFRCVARGRLAP